MRHLLLALALSAFGCGEAPEHAEEEGPRPDFIQAHLIGAAVVDLHLIDTSRGGSLGDPVLDCWTSNGHPDWGHVGDVSDDPILAEVYQDPTRESLSYRLPIDGTFALILVAQSADEPVYLRIDTAFGDNDVYADERQLVVGSNHIADIEWPSGVVTLH